MREHPGADTEKRLSMLDVPYGYCHCGCGELAPVAQRTDRCWGAIKGEPRRYIVGHNRRRGALYVVEDRGYETPCWVWTGCIEQAGGYGRVRRSGVTQSAHRWMYEQHVGPIPDNAELDHLCRVRPCVNPDHLEPVTHRENSHRGIKPKITQRDANHIRALRTGGWGARDIAESFGISKSRVYQIANGNGWT